MLFSVKDMSQIFGVRPASVLHVGAHEAEEAAEYASQNWGRATWVEMLPEKYAALKSRFEGDPNNVVLHAACWDVDGESLPIFRSQDTVASSVLAPDAVLNIYPDIHFKNTESILSSRLDTILPEETTFDFIALDIQGAELRAMKGMGSILARAKWLCLEVNTVRLYDGGALIQDIDHFLSTFGFRRIATRMIPEVGWGDGIYANTNLVKINFATMRAKAALYWVSHIVPTYLTKVARVIANPMRLKRLFRKHSAES